jgi:hypothetical protein
VYTVCQTLFCVTSTVFWKSICLWFCHIVPVLFLFCCCYCIYLYVSYLYDEFHILVLPLQTYRPTEDMYVWMNEWMNEWMNDRCAYSPILCWYLNTKEIPAFLDTGSRDLWQQHININTSCSHHTGTPLALQFSAVGEDHNIPATDKIHYISECNRLTSWCFWKH